MSADINDTNVATTKISAFIAMLTYENNTKNIRLGQGHALNTH